MKRIRAKFASESSARSAGLARAHAQSEGFDCECGKHHAFSPYVIAHWSDALQHRCVPCGRVHSLRAGIVKPVSGPVKRVSRIKEGAPPVARDPRQPFWRFYQVLANGVQPTSYNPCSDFAPSLQEAEALAWDYVEKVDPKASRFHMDKLFATLLRREEFPMMSTVEVDGLVVGAGDIQMMGSGIDEVRGCEVKHIELRDPRGRVTRITFTADVWAEIMVAFEMKPMSTKEALALDTERDDDCSPRRRRKCA